MDSLCGMSYTWFLRQAHTISVLCIKRLYGWAWMSAWIWMLRINWSCFGLEISNVIDWMFVPCLSLISISSYVVQGTKETGNMDAMDAFGHGCVTASICQSKFLSNGCKNLLCHSSHQVEEDFSSGQALSWTLSFSDQEWDEFFIVNNLAFFVCNIWKDYKVVCLCFFLLRASS